MAEEKILARRAFATLVMEAFYDYDADFGLPALCVCRVMIDGYFVTKLYADSVDDAITKFYEGKWVLV